MVLALAPYPFAPTPVRPGRHTPARPCTGVLPAELLCASLTPHAPPEASTPPPATAHTHMRVRPRGATRPRGGAWCVRPPWCLPPTPWWWWWCMCVRSAHPCALRPLRSCLPVVHVRPPHSCLSTHTPTHTKIINSSCLCVVTRRPLRASPCAAHLLTPPHRLAPHAPASPRAPGPSPSAPLGGTPRAPAHPDLGFSARSRGRVFPVSVCQEVALTRGFPYAPEA